MEESERVSQLRAQLAQAQIKMSQAYNEWSSYHERRNFIVDHLGEDPALADELAELDPKREAALEKHKSLRPVVWDLSRQVKRALDREAELERRRVKAEQAEIDRRWRESHPPIR